MHHVGFGGLGVDLGVAWIWAQRRGGVFGGVLVGSLLVSWGAKGSPTRKKGRAAALPSAYI